MSVYNDSSIAGFYIGFLFGFVLGLKYLVMAIEFDYDVDASGLICPLPLLRLKKTLVSMQSGEVVRVLATDPAAHLDIGVFSEQTGNRILEYSEADGTQCFFICKK